VFSGSSEVSSAVIVTLSILGRLVMVLAREMVFRPAASWTVTVAVVQMSQALVTDAVLVLANGTVAS
jgi:flavoprotein